MIRLIIEGPDIKTKKIDLEPGKTYVLGRDTNSDIVLSDHTISREHARIQTSLIGSMIIEDLDSTAGIYLNKKKVKGKAGVFHGDRLLMGKTFININAADHTGNITEAMNHDEVRDLLGEGWIGNNIRNGHSNFDSTYKSPFSAKHGAQESRCKSHSGEFGKKLIFFMMFLLFVGFGVGVSGILFSAGNDRQSVNKVTPAHQETSESASVRPATTEKSRSSGREDVDVSESVPHEPVSAGVDVLFEQSVEFYIQGKHQKALNKLGTVLTRNLPPGDPANARVVSLIDRITKIHSLFVKGCDQYNKRRFQQSIDTFRLVLELDKEIINNKSSYYSEQVFAYVVNSYYHIALTAYQEKDYARSRAYCTRALTLNPEHQGASRIDILLAGK